MNKVFAFILVLATTLTACDNYFGEKTDLDFIEIPDFQIRQAAYVPIQPILDNFVRPTDITAGFDNLIYVVDAATEEIISLDESGRELGRFSVPGVTEVTQSRNFDLLAIGTKDTIIADVDYTLTCIYHLNLKGLLGYGIKSARIVSEIVHPFYFKNSFSAADADVRFTGIGMTLDNSYYVTRTGNRNNPNQFGGPDDAVLLFSPEDEFISPISVSTSGSLFRDYFKKPSAIISSAVPPQINNPETPQAVNSPEAKSFAVLMADPNTAFKFRTITFVETDFGADYTPGGRVPEDTTRADGFITEPNKFTNPTDIAFANDGTNFIFIVDSETDSLYQFSGNGLEGVPPPPGSASNKAIKVSFGGTGVGATQLRNPEGVTYMNQILYVADSGNGRVLRFRLTTDFD